VSTRNQVEADLRRWLRSHHGVIGYNEALRLGASPGMIRSKVARGEWTPIYRGVYRHAATPSDAYQDLRAGYVATRGVGVVSHRSAAWVWGLLPGPRAMTELSVPTNGPRPRGHPHLIVHRSGDLDLSKVVHRHSIIVTNPLRTLVDIAGVIAPADLTEAVDAAAARHLVTIAGLAAELERLARPGRDGVGVLRRHLIERGFVGAPEPSVLEAHARRLVLRSGLPLPEVELRVGEEGEYRLDIAWPAIRFTIEVDGYAWHFSPEHLRRDLSRRNVLEQLGWTIHVFTWHEVVNRPDKVIAQITATYRRLAQ
jgi:REase_MTES_1575/Transcriptional regulator, AbiEi antitoxin